MKNANLLFRALSLVILALVSSCGGGGGSGAPSPVTITATPPHSGTSVALANGTDPVTVSARVTQNGAAAPDGTPVTFSVTGSGSLAATTVQTTGGVASTTVTHPPVAGANNATVTVTASALGGSSSTAVKFINQPTSAVVSIALTPSVTRLTSLQFGVRNDPGASFVVNAGNEQTTGTATGSLLAVGYDPAANLATPALINASGFTTGTSPIIQLTYAISSGLPTFSIDPGTPISASTTEPVTISPSNFSVTWRYNTE